MTGFRFLHTSDLHLGKPFGNFPEGIRGRLQEARHQSLIRLATAARQAGAAHVLVAGDTFDAETPAPETLRQALNAMGQATDLSWVLLPGNHDSLGASELWRRVAEDHPENVVLALDPQPIALAPHVTLLPAPCTQRRPGRDLTEWMDDLSDDGGIRIGLAHGAIIDFQSEDESPGIISPKRAELARLDYLALGDWHGALSIGPRTRYSGTPERDRFKHNGPGLALLVEIPGARALPDVTELPVGIFDWLDLTVELLPGEDPAGRLQDLLPDPAQRRDSLVRFTARGRTSLPERAALIHEIQRTQADFGWMSLDLDQLKTDASPGDLDEIDRAGALRAAAEALLLESEDPSLPESDRAVAAAALSRLYDYAMEERG